MITNVRALRDLSEINSWYEARGLPPMERSLVPSVGYIMPEVGAGFLISTDTSLGILEHFITNPKANAKDRHTAMDMIAGALIKAGKKAGLNNFIAITKHPFIMKLCDKHGLSEIKEMKIFGRKE